MTFPILFCNYHLDICLIILQIEMAWFHSNTISGTMPRAVCDLTNFELNRLWADCEEIDDNGHITSPLITCDCCHACFFN